MKTKRKQIALIGLPVLQTVNGLTNAAIANYAAQSGKWEFLFSARASVDAFCFLRQQKCDGAIVRILSPDMKREAERIKFPIVNISSWLEHPGVPTVRHDYAAMGRLAAEYLLGRGFRRFGCVLVPGGWFIQERCGGFEEVLRTRGLASETFRLKETLYLSGELAGKERQRFAAWAHGLKPPATLVLMDDGVAAAVMNTCLEAGLAIPRDLAVISMGLHGEHLPRVPVPLTAVQANNDLQAELAIQCLDAMMSGRKPSAPIITVPPYGLVERTSTATLAIEDRELAQAIDFVRVHGCEDISVLDITKHLGISRVTFERRLRKATGMSPHELITRQRIIHAQELLLERPPLTLAEITRKCGFNDRRLFNVFFKRSIGKTPAEWRATQLKMEELSGRKQAPPHAMKSPA